MTWVPGSTGYLHHLKEQNVCETCEQHFMSPSNLDNVSRSLVTPIELKLTPVLASNSAFKTID
jgi:hypothetical protein